MTVRSATITSSDEFAVVVGSELCIVLRRLVTVLDIAKVTGVVWVYGVVGPT